MVGTPRCGVLGGRPQGPARRGCPCLQIDTLLAKQFFLTLLFKTVMLSPSALLTIPGWSFGQGFRASLIQSTY
jgi:hypothetical protein